MRNSARLPISVLIVAIVGLVVVTAPAARAQTCSCAAAGTTSVCDAAGLAAISGGLSANYALCNDVVLPPGFAPISGVFTGLFDGRSHAITGFTVDEPTGEKVGFFREVGAFGRVRNLRMVNASVVGHTDVGTIAGKSFGQMQNLSVIGSYVRGTYYAGGNVGGAVGQLRGGTLDQVSVDATTTVEGENQVWSIGGAAGYCFGGGFYRVTSAARVMGDPTGGGMVGGIVGLADQCAITSVTSSGTVSGYQWIGGIASGLYGPASISGAAVYGSVIVNGGGSSGAGIVYGSVNSFTSTIRDTVVYNDGPVGLLSGVLRWSATPGSSYLQRNLVLCAGCGLVSAGTTVSPSPNDSFFQRLPGEPARPVYDAQGRTPAQLATLATYTSAGWNMSNTRSTVWYLASGATEPQLSFDRVCGNSTPTGSEQCDDGNLTSGDGCSSSCKAEYCGNLVLDVGEECDDGNHEVGDGCGASCDAEYCGDTIVSGGEDCDDGNTVGGDGCTDSCDVDGHVQWRPLAGAPTAVNINWYYTMGYHFTPAAPSFATEVGGLWNGTKPVRLYDRMSGALLAQVNVASANTFAYGALGSPIPLAANRGYTVAAVIGGTGGSYRVMSAPFPLTARDVRIDSSTWLWGDGRPTNTEPWYMYGQADVEVRAAVLERPWQQAENGNAPTTTTYTNWLFGYEWSADDDGAVFALGGKVQGPFTAVMFNVATGQELARVDIVGTSTSAYTYGQLGVPVSTYAMHRYVVAIWLSGDEIDVIRMHNAPLPLASGNVIIERMIYDWELRAPRGTLFHMLGQADMEWAPLPQP